MGSRGEGHAGTGARPAAPPNPAATPTPPPSQSPPSRPRPSPTHPPPSSETGQTYCRRKRRKKIGELLTGGKKTAGCRGTPVTQSEKKAAKTDLASLAIE